LIGHKVDSIGYYRNQIKELLPKIQSAQRSHLAGKEKLASAVFIEFNTMAAAEAAFNDNQHRRPTDFSARQMGVLPEEVIWKNLNMGSKNRFIRHILATIAISALIIFWAIPVALVGIISNVNYLTENVPFLAWIDSIPQVILGVVTGLLPVVLLAVLMALVPVICRCKLLIPVPSTLLTDYYNSFRKALGSCHHLRSRTAVSDMVLCFPGYSSLPYYDLYFQRLSGR
jgi:signal recognition particle receptor subunit alpha